MFRIIKLNSDNIIFYIDYIYDLEVSNFHDEAYNKETIYNLLNEYDNIELLLMDDKFVGYIIYRCLDIIHLLKICVDNNYRGNNYGKLLIDSMINNSNGLKRIYLEVRKNNTSAVNFYIRNHFEIIHEKQDYYKNPKDDALIMVRYD